ncbi:MAG: hypothetical protein KAI88_05155, partial [Nitrosomonadaceae bacterium]|nr:hypothetical protein [Nitrosomonadaceae bacterium]
MVARAFFEPIKTLAFGGISGAYATVGAVTDKPCRVICISNATQGDMYFTVDSSEDQMFVPAGSFKLYDIQANQNPRSDDSYVLEVGTQFYVKQITAPVDKAVYIE